MPTSPLAQALLTFAIATCLAALWKGGKAERIAAVLILINTALFTGDRYLPQDMLGVTYLAADAIAALGMLALTLRYGQVWLGMAMLLYAGQFALHAYYFVLNKPPTDLFHVTMNNLNFLGVLLCVAWGTGAAIRRRGSPKPIA